MALVLTPTHTELRKQDELNLVGSTWILSRVLVAHRRKFGGGRGEAVAKAVGIKRIIYHRCG